MVKNTETKKFAAGLCFRKLFFIFLIGSVFGAFWEQGLHLVQTWLETGAPEWSLRRGVIYGPFNVIYGFGAALMVYILGHKPYDNWQVFGLAAIVGGLTEYVISFLQEFFTHTTSWDYSGMFLNINGRTTIPYMIVWGLLGLFLIRVIYPPVSRLIEKIPPKTGEIIFRALLIFMIFDALISWTALIRQTLRHNDIPAITPVGEFYDYYYTDDFLEKYYPNMVHEDLKNE